jgi:membrane protease YdiL (CAAX protease family)
MDPFASLFGIIAILVLIASVVGSFVCFILVLIQMFRRDQQTLGLVCIFLALLAGMGTIVAFIFGWLKATEWRIKRTMVVWTVCYVLQFFGVLLVMFALIGYTRARVREEIHKANQAPRPRIEVHNHSGFVTPNLWFSMDRH